MRTHQVDLTDTRHPMQCCVCMEEDDGICMSLACGHAFHTTCISMWLLRSSTCPVCRRIIATCERKKHIWCSRQLSRGITDYYAVAYENYQLGLWLAELDSRVVVGGVVPGMGAYQGGLRPGMTIVSINHVLCSSLLVALEIVARHMYSGVCCPLLFEASWSS